MSTCGRHGITAVPFAPPPTLSLLSTRLRLDPCTLPGRTGRDKNGFGLRGVLGCVSKVRPMKSLIGENLFSSRSSKCWFLNMLSRAEKKNSCRVVRWTCWLWYLNTPWYTKSERDIIKSTTRAILSSPPYISRSFCSTDFAVMFFITQRSMASFSSSRIVSLMRKL